MERKKKKNKKKRKEKKRERLCVFDCGLKKEIKLRRRKKKLCILKRKREKFRRIYRRELLNNEKEYWEMKHYDCWKNGANAEMERTNGLNVTV